MDFEEVYQSYFHDVYLFLRSLSASEDIAEELTQEAFAKALRALDSFDWKKDIRAWLFTIARNTYYTYCRKQKRFSHDADVEGTTDECFAERIADEESAFAAHRFLHDMSEPYKEVFTLRVFGELSFEKIGRLFGRSDSWARVTFFRAKRQLIKHMEGFVDDKDQL